MISDSSQGPGSPFSYIWGVWKGITTMISLFLFRISVAVGSSAQAFLLQHRPLAILSQNAGGKRSSGGDSDVGDGLPLVCYGSTSALYQDIRE